MSEVKHLIMATAGHVDHGKSALVKALTGTDPDRLPEEKSRGITIDLGFAQLELHSAATPKSSYLLGIVDVPGHEDFVKNMVAGVGSIDLALLVVAADDGWMPQTEEHSQILTYLGVNRAVVALTKIDLVQDEKKAIDSIRDRVRNLPFADAPIVPTSVITGRGLDELKATLAEIAAKAPPPRDIGKPRLSVDRVFNLQGIGTVVTGTLAGGTLRRGQNVIVQPSGKAARIRTIQSHNHNEEVIGPGTRTALNLPNLTAEEGIQRGDIVTAPEFGRPSETIDVLLQVSARANRAIKDGARVWIHHGSASVAARVVFFSEKQLDVGGLTVAQVRLESPAFVFVGDRFVVRDWSARNTLAGGIVLDADSRTASFRSGARLNFLTQRAKAPDDASSHVVSYIVSQLTRDGAAKRSSLLVKSRFSQTEIGEAVSGLVAEGGLTLTGEYVIDTPKWKAVCLRATEAIDRVYRAHPEYAGMPVSDLRAILKPNLLFDSMFDEVVKHLCTGDFVKVGAAIRRGTHQPALPAHLQAAGTKLRATLSRKPFDPPSRKELCPDLASQQALRFFLETGEAVEINAEVVMAAESERCATELIRKFIHEHGPATVSELRQQIGTSRRVIIPLLERLDRIGVTVRKEDKRDLRR